MVCEKRCTYSREHNKQREAVIVYGKVDLTKKKARALIALAYKHTNFYQDNVSILHENITSQAGDTLHSRVFPPRSGSLVVASR